MSVERFSNAALPLVFIVERETHRTIISLVKNDLRRTAKEGMKEEIIQMIPCIVIRPVNFNLHPHFDSTEVFSYSSELLYY